MIQIFVRADVGETVALEATLSDKAEDVKRRIQNKMCSRTDDLYVGCEGEVLDDSDEMRTCGIDDGCTVHMHREVRGGGVHKNTKLSKQNQAKSCKSMQWR